MIDLPSPQDCPDLLVEFDAAGQEVRFMAALSGDRNMIDVFNHAPPDDDLHSFMGAQLGGMEFQTFLEGLRKKIEYIAGKQGLRYQGKFTNLSCQYRIGIKSLRIKARVDYGMDVGWEVAKGWKDTYLKAFPDVELYWDYAIELAKKYGYAETLGGRRYRIDFFDVPDLKWASEQSAINMPIQGSGADMKELAIAIMNRVHPQFRFAWDLHDGIFYRLTNTASAVDQILEARETLNQLPYKEAWNWESPIPMLWDAAVGIDWGHMQEVK